MGARSEPTTHHYRPSGFRLEQSPKWRLRRGDDRPVVADFRSRLSRRQCPQPLRSRRGAENLTVSSGSGPGSDSRKLDVSSV